MDGRRSYLALLFMPSGSRLREDSRTYPSYHGCVLCWGTPPTWFFSFVSFSFPLKPPTRIWESQEFDELGISGKRNRLEDPVPQTHKKPATLRSPFLPSQAHMCGTRRLLLWLKKQVFNKRRLRLPLKQPKEREKTVSTPPSFPGKIPEPSRSPASFLEHPSGFSVEPKGDSVFPFLEVAGCQKDQETAGVGPCFHLTGSQSGYLFLTHAHIPSFEK